LGRWERKPAVGQIGLDDCLMEFIEDLASRLANRVQITTDGHKAYLDAIDTAFGDQVDYAMLVKLYGPSMAAAIALPISRDGCISGLDKSPRKIKLARHVHMRMALMKTLVRLIIVGALVLSFSAVGYAQMQATPPAAPATPAAPVAPKAKAPMSAEDMAKKAKSNECLAKANEQGLHGKAKDEFRAKCVAS
jgi:hypothetical protein